MKFTCQTQKLKKAISIVEKAISPKNAVPVLENIFFEVQNETLFLKGNNLEVGISFQSTVNNQSNDSTSFLIKGSTISSILSKINSETVTIEKKTDSQLQISADSINFKILCQEATDYPEFPSIEEGIHLSLKVEQLRELIKHTIFSVSTDETKQFLTGVMVKVDGKKITFVSTDGFRLSLMTNELAQDSPKTDVIVPFKAMNELGKVLHQEGSEKDVSVTVSKNQIAFVLGDFVLISRVIQGQFPDYNQVIPNETANIYTIPRRLLVLAAERSEIIAMHTNQVIRLIFNGDTVAVNTRAAQVGEFNEEVAIKKVKGEGEVKVCFNVKLLLDAIRNTDSDDIQIQFDTEISPCLITPSSQEEIIYVVMPIRTSEFEQDSSSDAADSVSAE